jgi:UDP-glucose:(heptosyl)LPS alpha-1,3-glucosyltransferase
MRRVALVQQNFNLRGSLAREGFFLARWLVGRGFEVECYCDPTTRTALGGVRFHDVRPMLRSQARFAVPVEVASFAAAAGKAVRRNRSRHDVVYVTGTAAWEHDVIRAHAVMRAEQHRWPDRGGRTFRAARLRAELSPALRPVVAVVRTIERLQFRPGRFGAVLAVSEEVRRDLEGVHGVDPALIHVWPLPVDVERFAIANGSSAVRNLLRVDDRVPLLLFVGHDFERKGLSEAIRALRDLDPPAHLVVVGDGDRRAFERIAEQESVRDRVHFVGGTDQPESFFAAADAFVLPTREDVWGMAFVEAMAAGLPIVATEVAGAADVVRSAAAGLIVRDGRPDEIRSAIGAILRNPSERRAMGERGRVRAADYGIERFGEAALAAFGTAQTRAAITEAVPT